MQVCPTNIDGSGENQIAGPSSSRGIKNCFSMTYGLPLGPSLQHIALTGNFMWKVNVVSPKICGEVMHRGNARARLRGRMISRGGLLNYSIDVLLLDSRSYLHWRMKLVMFLAKSYATTWGKGMLLSGMLLFGKEKITILSRAVRNVPLHSGGIYIDSSSFTKCLDDV
jgi:hypothetical protein